jgi:hypothetical protein
MLHLRKHLRILGMCEPMYSSERLACTIHRIDGVRQLFTGRHFCASRSGDGVDAETVCATPRRAKFHATPVDEHTVTSRHSTFRRMPWITMGKSLNLII